MDVHDGGVHESVEAAARTALLASMQIAERAMRARAELLADAARRDQALARELTARFEAERSVAVAQLAVVQQPRWWEHATPADMAHVAGLAADWADRDSTAATALQTISSKVRDRYGLNLDGLAGGLPDSSAARDQRAAAQSERTEAAALIQAADRLDAAADATGEQPRDPAAFAAEAGAVLPYDSVERRGHDAAAMLAAGIDPADVTVRMRADVNAARPASDAPAAGYQTGPSGARGPAAARGRARERER